MLDVHHKVMYNKKEEKTERNFENTSHSRFQKKKTVIRLYYLLFGGYLS